MSCHRQRLRQEPAPHHWRCGRHGISLLIVALRSHVHRLLSTDASREGKRDIWGHAGRHARSRGALFRRSLTRFLSISVDHHFLFRAQPSPPTLVDLHAVISPALGDHMPRESGRTRSTWAPPASAQPSHTETRRDQTLHNTHNRRTPPHHPQLLAARCTRA